MHFEQGFAQQETSGTFGSGGLAPPKKWDGLADSEKIERMRDKIKEQGRFIETLLTNMAALMEHSHQDGKIVAPLSHAQGFLFAPGINQPDDYF